MRITWSAATAAFAVALGLGLGATGASAQAGATSQDLIMLNVGDRAPIFEAVADNGQIWRSRENIGRGQILVVYFYPAAMTTGCTTQACTFRDNQSVLMELGANVVGVSGDRVDGLKVFKGVNKLNFTLLSDTEGAVARVFGVPTRDGGTITRQDVDGHDVNLTTDVRMARWTFVIDTEGRISYKAEDVNPQGDPIAVIEHIRQLRASADR
jgi:peroxiredoxin Q/BCP